MTEIFLPGLPDFPIVLRRSARARRISLRVSRLDGRVTLTIEETAKLLGIGRSAAYEAARRGELPSRRLGRRVVVPVPALVVWLGAGGGV